MTAIKGVTFKVPTTYSTLYAVDPEQEQAICKKVGVPLLPRKVQEIKDVKDANTGKYMIKQSK